MSSTSSWAELLSNLEGVKEKCLVARIGGAHVKQRINSMVQFWKQVHRQVSESFDLTLHSKVCVSPQFPTLLLFSLRFLKLCAQLL